MIVQTFVTICDRCGCIANTATHRVFVHAIPLIPNAQQIDNQDLCDRCLQVVRDALRQAFKEK